MPEYEEREAATFGHYNWSEWEALTHEARVQGVAHFRLHHLIQTHLADIGERRAAEAARRAAR